MNTLLDKEKKSPAPTKLNNGNVLKDKMKFQLHLATTLHLQQLIPPILSYVPSLPRSTSSGFFRELIDLEEIIAQYCTPKNVALV